MGGLPALPITNQVQHRHFHGCISDLYIDHKFIDLSSWVFVYILNYYQNFDCMNFFVRLEASEPKWVNSNDIQYGVNLLRLEGLNLR